VLENNIQSKGAFVFLAIKWAQIYKMFKLIEKFKSV